MAPKSLRCTAVVSHCDGEVVPRHYDVVHVWRRDMCIYLHHCHHHHHHHPSCPSAAGGGGGDDGGGYFCCFGPQAPKELLESARADGGSGQEITITTVPNAGHQLFLVRRAASCQRAHPIG